MNWTKPFEPQMNAVRRSKVPLAGSFRIATRNANRAENLTPILRREPLYTAENKYVISLPT
jgi:hypothetical protein